ncbi:MAG: DUF805 domain-containing protein [Aquiluna sp.]
MTFVGAIQSGFRNYFNFRGKASRPEFWYWVLFTVLLSLVVSTVESVIWPAEEVVLDANWMQNLDSLSAQPTPISNFLSFALLIPNLSVTARRFHDAGFSAKWLFLQLVPLGYGIFAGVGVVAMLTASAPGQMLSREELMSLVFLVLPIFALLLAVLVIYMVFALKPSKSFFDGNRYVEPEPLDSFDEGTTA